MKEETLKREYTENALTITEIAEKYNKSVSTVYSHLLKFNIAIRPRHKNPTKTLTKIQEEFLFGKILGDGYLKPNTDAINSNFSFAHEIKQKDYCFYSHSFISDWCTTEPIYRTQELNPKIYKKSLVEKYVVETISHPEFSRLRRYFYEQGKKIINKDILDNLSDLSLAIWYQDDGSIETNSHSGTKVGIRLHVNQFNLTSVQLICKWFEDKYGLLCAPQKSMVGKDGQQQYCIRFAKSNTSKFCDIVKPHMDPSMCYKLVDDIV
jgi:hypothetical protein